MITLSFVLAYVLGSIPFGYIIAKKAYGLDITTKGSGNIGSTNMNRIIGRKASIITQILDISKGLIPVIVALLINSAYEHVIDKNIYISLIALTTIIGHDFTPFLNFNGGKGVNTTIGSFFLMSPIAVLSGVLMYFLLKPITNIVFIRSLSLGLTMLVLSCILKVNTITLLAMVIANVLLIIRHRPNIEDYLKNKKNA